MMKVKPEQIVYFDDWANTSGTYTFDEIYENYRKILLYLLKVITLLSWKEKLDLNSILKKRKKPIWIGSII